MKTPTGTKTKATVWVVENDQVRSRLDQLTTEEPLEIRLMSPRRTVAVTMRTPGADFAWGTVQCVLWNGEDKYCLKK